VFTPHRYTTPYQQHFPIRKVFGHKGWHQKCPDVRILYKSAGIVASIHSAEKHVSSFSQLPYAEFLRGTRQFFKVDLGGVSYDTSLGQGGREGGVGCSYDIFTGLGRPAEGLVMQRQDHLLFPIPSVVLYLRDRPALGRTLLDPLSAQWSNQQNTMNCENLSIDHRAQHSSTVQNQGSKWNIPPLCSPPSLPPSLPSFPDEIFHPPRGAPRSAKSIPYC